MLQYGDTLCTTVLVLRCVLRMKLLSCEQVPGLRYVLRVRLRASAGVATAGVAFFDSKGMRLEVYALHVASAGAHSSHADAADGNRESDEQGGLATAVVDAPQGAAAASVYAGKLDGECGSVEVLPCLVPLEAVTHVIQEAPEPYQGTVTWRWSSSASHKPCLCTAPTSRRSCCAPNTICGSLTHWQA